MPQVNIIKLRTHFSNFVKQMQSRKKEELARKHIKIQNLNALLYLIHWLILLVNLKYRNETIHAVMQFNN